MRDATIEAMEVIRNQREALGISDRITFRLNSRTVTGLPRDQRGECIRVDLYDSKNNHKQ